VSGGWSPEAICPICGKGPFKSQIGWQGHFRRKDHQDSGLEPVLETQNGAVLETAPLKVVPKYTDPIGDKNYQLTPGLRSLKMVAPVHDECQKRDRGPGWWYRCEAQGHNPYFTADHYGNKTEEVVELDADGDLVVTGTKTKKIKIPGAPNLRQVPYTGRHNADENTAIRKARGEGLRFPEELGLSPRCQFWNCWIKVDAEATDTTPRRGDFCDEAQAKVARADKRGTMLEVLNDEKKEKQWATL
jgi:hypothetical protein